MGHMGIDRPLDLVHTRFYWPKMAAGVEIRVQNCDCCVRRKAFPEKAAPLVNIMATCPLKLDCMDFLSLEPDSSNAKDTLVITNHSTKFELYYGIPEKMHTAQGTDLESKLINELWEVVGI